MALSSIFGNIASASKKMVTGVFKDNSATTIKTTSKFTGNTNKVVSGGSTVAKQNVSKFAQGVGTTAKVGGVVFGATAITGGTTLAATKIWDYIGDVRAKTEDIRQYDMLNKLSSEESDIAEKERQRLLDFAKETGTSASLSASGGTDGSGGLFPTMGKALDNSGEVALQEAETANTKTLVYGAGGLILLVGGLYLLNKKVGKKK